MWFRRCGRRGGGDHMNWLERLAVIQRISRLLPEGVVAAIVTKRGDVLYVRSEELLERLLRVWTEELREGWEE